MVLVAMVTKIISFNAEIRGGCRITERTVQNMKTMHLSSATKMVSFLYFCLFLNYIFETMSL